MCGAQGVISSWYMSLLHFSGGRLCIHGGVGCHRRTRIQRGIDRTCIGRIKINTKGVGEHFPTICQRLVTCGGGSSTPEIFLARDTTVNAQRRTGGK